MTHVVADRVPATIPHAGRIPTTMKVIEISASARSAGASVVTIRHDQRRGMLQPDGRGPTGYRASGQDPIERLRLIVDVVPDAGPEADEAHLEAIRWSERIVVGSLKNRPAQGPESHAAGPDVVRPGRDA